MKANELRIGNLVLVNDKIIVVESVHDQGINYYQSGPYNDDSYEAEFDRNFSSYNIIKGIPLTEEWLLKFGFEQIPREGYSIALPGHNKRLYVPFDKENEVRIMSPIGILTIAKNVIQVHQLQNIFFALSGEELKP